ncbi:MAG TPA: ATP-binding protein [Tissierellaceae bacterium]|nr:ATP-binding protein [Tissierellaceae bacterium]
MDKDKRVRIVIGHYGSGKTEFSVNYAAKLAQNNKKAMLVDLDVINLYFRSREKAEELESMGVRVIGGAIDANAIDIPTIPAEVVVAFEDESYDAVLDVGGDPDGTRTLGRYTNYLTEGNYDMFFVLNANRPETQTVEKAMEYMIKIQDVARAKITGIVNNTHMLKSTSIDDVLKGYDLSLKISEKTGVPLRYNVVLKDLASQLPQDLEGEIFPIELYMREEWML